MIPRRMKTCRWCVEHESWFDRHVLERLPLWFIFHVLFRWDRYVWDVIPKAWHYRRHVDSDGYPRRPRPTLPLFDSGDPSLSDEINEMFGDGERRG